MPLNGIKLGVKIILRRLVFHLYGAALKVIPTPGKCTRSAMWLSKASGTGPLCPNPIKAGNQRSPQNLQTCMRPLEHIMQNREFMKKRHCATLVFSFVTRIVNVTISFYAELSRKAKVMVAVKTVSVAANGFNPCEQILGLLQTGSFPD
ncbi:hypothetical protein TNCV_4881391 [Trichonephila clavipes]|nr:hypothetical protein TNCV_4881391 [Trichonephila clavipes]